MPWSGACNRCGDCGCLDVGGLEKWYPGIGGSKMPWGKMYPSRDLDVCALIRTAFTLKYGHEWDKEYGGNVVIRIAGGGPPIYVDCYITTRGIQKLLTDASCPFLESIINATISGTTFTATTVTGSDTTGSVVGNLAVASGGAVGIVSTIAPNTLTVYGWVRGTPTAEEIVEVRENECTIWGRNQLPPACNNNPQTFADATRIAAWEANHPHTDNGGTCGWKYV